MAYTLLDAAYEMYYPEAEFSKAGMLRRAGRKARVAAGRTGRVARRAGGVAMRNKGKVALGALALGAGGLYAGSVAKRVTNSPRSTNRAQAAQAVKNYRAG